MWHIFALYKKGTTVRLAIYDTEETANTAMGLFIQAFTLEVTKDKESTLERLQLVYIDKE